MPNPHWYDPETDPSPVYGRALESAASLHAGGVCSYDGARQRILVQAIMSAIDDYAERETGNREYFWGKRLLARLQFRLGLGLLPLAGVALTAALLTLRHPHIG